MSRATRGWKRQAELEKTNINANFDSSGEEIAFKQAVARKFLVRIDPIYAGDNPADLPEVIAQNKRQQEKAAKEADEQWAKHVKEQERAAKRQKIAAEGQAEREEQLTKNRKKARQAATKLDKVGLKIYKGPDPSLIAARISTAQASPEAIITREEAGATAAVFREDIQEGINADILPEKVAKEIKTSGSVTVGGTQYAVLPRQRAKTLQKHLFTEADITGEQSEEEEEEEIEGSPIPDEDVEAFEAAQASLKALSASSRAKLTAKLGIRAAPAAAAAAAASAPAAETAEQRMARIVANQRAARDAANRTPEATEWRRNLIQTEFDARIKEIEANRKARAGGLPAPLDKPHREELMKTLTSIVSNLAPFVNFSFGSNLGEEKSASVAKYSNIENYLPPK